VTTATVDTRARRIALAASLAVAAAVAATPRASAVVQPSQIVVLLCTFTDTPVLTQDVAYFRRFFAERRAAGETGLGGVFDYWTDISYGQLNFQVVVPDWISVPMTSYEFTGKASLPEDCAPHAPNGGITLNDYLGVIVIPNLDQQTLVDDMNPSVASLSQGVNADDVEVQVDCTGLPTDCLAGFPAPPFRVSLGVENDGSQFWMYGGESVWVDAVDGTTWTLRAPAALEHDARKLVAFFNDPRTQGQAGTAWLPPYTDAATAAHEMMHLLNMNHSRKLSDPTQDYQDPWDTGSVATPYSTPGAYDVTVLDSNGLDVPYNGGLGGPGLNAVNLDVNGWLTIEMTDRKEPFDNGFCHWQTFTMPALNRPDVHGPLAVLIPAQLMFNTADAAGNPITTTSSHYYAEFRHRSSWDSRLPADAVLLHVNGSPGHRISYWVDMAGTDGALGPGESFADTAQDAYVSVNRIDPNPAAPTATVTVGACPIGVSTNFSGATSGNYADLVILSVDLTVNGSGAPLPNAEVTLTVGSQSCNPATTDADGHASCVLRLNEQPGNYTLGATYAGDAAYQSASASQAFTINRAPVTLALSGATGGDYGDAVTLAADLNVSSTGDPIPNAEVTLTLGNQSCPQGTKTNSAGRASCSITLNQVPGPYTAQAAFAGDAFYLPASASGAFTINREQTSLVISGGAFIAVGEPVSAVLTEADGAALAGKSVVLTITSAGSCSATTTASGTATCTIPVANHPLGPATLTAAFAGDTFYLPTSSQRSVTSFAWTVGGNFVIGDGSAAVGATATFWADDWYLRNAVSGGLAPDSFKGFANIPAGSTLCGGTWSTSGGNSPPPAASVPEYTAVLVTSSVTKSGATITGSKPLIVIVRVNPGYAPRPGRLGTAVVLGRLC
jgi:hypothetical protein